MGVLNHLIAPRRPARKRLAASPRSPLSGLLLSQFEALGLRAGAVPSHGPTGSAWSRAYVLGAACASLQHQDAAPISDEECFAVAHTAFAMTYGEAEARRVLVETIAAADAHEPEVEDGLLHGAADLAAAANGASSAPQFAERNVADLIEVEPI